VSNPAPLDPERLLKTLDSHGVSYVLIGALAARLQGFPRLTADADLTPAPGRENLARLAAALGDLGARVFMEGIPEGFPFDCSAATLGRAETWNLVTEAGRLDLVFRPTGTDGYEDLRKGAVGFQAFGVHFLAASLQDLIRTKEASDRPQDRQDVVVMRGMLR
jgi:hypothetical protein